MRAFRIIFAVLFLGSTVAMITYSLYHRFHLERHYKVSRGMITSVTPPPAKSSTRGVEFEYVINGIRYQGHSYCQACSWLPLNKLNAIFSGKHFFIVYDSIYPSFSHMILRINEAERYRIKVNDTIQWTDAVLNCDYIPSDLELQ